MPGRRGSTGGRLADVLARPLRTVERAPERRASPDTAPSRTAPPAAVAPVRPSWAPPGSTPVAHPDLGDRNNAFRLGDHSWRDEHGVTHTRVSDFVGFHGGAAGKQQAFLAAGHPFRQGDPWPDGNHDPNWKAFWVQDSHTGDWTGMPGDSVLEYRHGRPATLLTPHHEISNVDDGRTALGVPAGHLVDTLGGRGQILRNPLVDPDRTDGTLMGHEYAVPWSTAAGGTVKPA